jgi:sugar phosphate isomerase/epimerase
MELGLYTDSLPDHAFEEALDVAARVGATAIEIATGGQSRAPHLRLDELLGDAARRAAFRDAFSSRGLRIAALNCSAWPLHPAGGERHVAIIRSTIRLAAELGVTKLVTMSGNPGDGATGTAVNFVWYPWPEESMALLERQWDEAITLWQDLGEEAKAAGIETLAFELHPLHLVYNVPTYERMRDAVGPIIGVNLDPSHLFWQGMDPLVCVRGLGDAIFHVHAKDTWLDSPNIRLNGVLDTNPYTDEIHRSWIFRTVGFGHGQEFWRSLISELRLAGYNGAISIEHEDSLMSINEGFTSAVDFLKDVVIRETPGQAWWV